MDYFAGLDVSMEETHVCVVDRDGAVKRSLNFEFIQLSPNHLIAPNKAAKITPALRAVSPNAARYGSIAR